MGLDYAYAYAWIMLENETILKRIIGTFFY